MEIEKIIALEDAAGNEEEKKAISRARETLEEVFCLMIGDVPASVLGGERKKRDLSDVIEALRLLHRCGKKYGIHIPHPRTEEEAAMYVIHYGSEVVRNRPRDTGK